MSQNNIGGGCGYDSGCNNSGGMQLRSQTNRQLRTKRQKDVKDKLEQILSAINGLTAIETICEDAMLQWLCGPVSAAITRLIKGRPSSTCTRQDDKCHKRQMERLNNMHGEIKKIHQNKIAELRRKRIAAENFIRKNSRKFKKTRSSRHEECHICLIQFENDAQTIRLPNCQHECHQDCLRPWIREKSTCPICRTSIDELVGLTDSTSRGSNSSTSPSTSNQDTNQNSSHEENLS